MISFSPSLCSHVKGCEEGRTTDGLVVCMRSLYVWKEEMVEPAVRGTRYVIHAAANAGTVRRVVFTSSIGAVTMDPGRGPDVVVDESCWSDVEHCKNTRVSARDISMQRCTRLVADVTVVVVQNWYCYGKAVAEQAAWEVARETGLELAVVNPVLALGPLLQPQVNASIAHILKYLDGSATRYTNAVQGYVDVRDVAEAHVRVFEAEAAAGKRFICAERVLHREDVVRILSKLFPEYPVPNT
ncbi:hypothetical protein BHM03_00060353 [Ensete ventricosum]|nr:hypothetical protein BHM03_00060353 [Ensete ventricosum]